jgi:hypothetical protein
MLYSPLAMSFQKNSIFNSSSPAAASRIYNFTFDAPRTHPESLFSKEPNLLRIDPKKSLLPKKVCAGSRDTVLQHGLAERQRSFTNVNAGYFTLTTILCFFNTSSEKQRS